MPEIASAALLEQDGAVLVAHRRAGGRPFGDRWMLPFEIVRGDETAEEALARHLREQRSMWVHQAIWPLTTVHARPPDHTSPAPSTCSSMIASWPTSRPWLIR